MSTYENHTLAILDGNCDGMGREFASWVRENYPEITVDLQLNTCGVGGGLFDDDGNQVDDRLWDEFCNSYDELSVCEIDAERLIADVENVAGVPVFEDSYGDGVALVSSDSYPSYRALADAFDLDLSDYCV